MWSYLLNGIKSQCLVDYLIFWKLPKLQGPSTLNYCCYSTVDYCHTDPFCWRTPLPTSSFAFLIILIKYLLFLCRMTWRDVSAVYSMIPSATMNFDYTIRSLLCFKIYFSNYTSLSKYVWWWRYLLTSFLFQDNR